MFAPPHYKNKIELALLIGGTCRYGNYKNLFFELWNSFFFVLGHPHPTPPHPKTTSIVFFPTPPSSPKVYISCLNILGMFDFSSFLKSPKSPNVLKCVKVVTNSFKIT